MRSIYLTSALLSLAVSANSQLVNGGFEEWVPLPGYDVPVNPEQAFSNSNELTFFFWDVLSMYEVEGVSGSAMRVESTSNGDEVEAGYAVWGNPPDGDELLFTGGFPMTDSDVTGISCDLRYNINFNSPGFIIVQFKNDGVPAGEGSIGPGTYAFPLLGSQPEFTSMDFTFDPPVPSSIDECVIGFASNNVLDEETVAFEGNFIEVDNLVFIDSETPIPGGDFDTWLPANEVLVPEGWNVPPFFSLNLVERTTDAASGDYAVQLNSVAVGSEVLAALVYQGEAVDGQGVLPTVPVTGQLESISFAYKYETPGNDLGFAVVVLSEELNPSEEDLYFSGDFLEPSSEYSETTIDLSWVSELINVNYVAVAFLSSWDDDGGSGNSPVGGSTLYIDDVSLNTIADPCDVVVEIEQGDMLMLCPAEFATISVPDEFESYQWYRELMFGGEPELLDGETEAALQVDAVNFSVYNVWCEVSFDDCTVESSIIGIDSFVFVPTVIASTETAICEGETTTLEALGAQGTVAWFQNGIELEGENDQILMVTEPGTYMASIFPTECPDTELSSGIGVTIVVHPNPTPELQFGVDDEISVIGGDFVNFEWYYEGNLVEGANSSSIPFQSDSGGHYLVIVTDANGCQGTAEDVLFSVGETSAEQLMLYPNPANEHVVVNALHGEYMVFDLTGRMVDQGSAFGEQVVISVGHLASGSYFLFAEGAATRFQVQR